MVLLGFDGFVFNAPKEKVNGMVGDRSDSEFLQKISKMFLKVAEEKGVNCVYPVDWINRKGEKQKCNIMINAEIFKGTLFIQTTETTEGTWL